MLDVSRASLSELEELRRLAGLAEEGDEGARRQVIALCAAINARPEVAEPVRAAFVPPPAKPRCWHVSPPVFARHVQKVPEPAPAPASPVEPLAVELAPVVTTPAQSPIRESQPPPVSRWSEHDCDADRKWYSQKSRRSSGVMDVEF